MKTERIKIKIEIKSRKPYCGKIVGLSAQYGVDVEFLPLDRISAGLHTATITDPGHYKVVPRETVASARRIDTGYILVAEDGTVTEIAKEIAVAYATSVNPSVIPPLAQN